MRAVGLCSYSDLDSRSGSHGLRDKYFAYAGLASGVDQDLVGYSKGFRKVSLEFGRMTLVRGSKDYDRRGLDTLAFAVNPMVVELDLPSWIPDLLLPSGRQFNLMFPYRNLNEMSPGSSLVTFNVNNVSFNLEYTLPASVTDA